METGDPKTAKPGFKMYVIVLLIMAVMFLGLKYFRYWINNEGYHFLPDRLVKHACYSYFLDPELFIYKNKNYINKKKGGQGIIYIARDIDENGRMLLEILLHNPGAAVANDVDITKKQVLRKGIRVYYLTTCLYYPKQDFIGGVSQGKVQVQLRVLASKIGGKWYLDSITVDKIKYSLFTKSVIACMLKQRIFLFLKMV